MTKGEQQTRERKVVALLAAGLDQHVIRERLGISESAIRTLVYRLKPRKAPAPPPKPTFTECPRCDVPVEFPEPRHCANCSAILNARIRRWIEIPRERFEADDFAIELGITRNTLQQRISRMKRKGLS